MIGFHSSSKQAHIYTNAGENVTLIIAERHIIMFLVSFIAIVTQRRGLSAACDDRETALIISIVAPLYQCKTTKKFIILHKE